MNVDSDNYLRLAVAFVRGHLTGQIASDLALFDGSLHNLTEEQTKALLRLGRAHGLRLHKFKRTVLLRRVRAALGILQGLQPLNLLDIGSGRGAFVWPLLDAFPALPVTCIDLLDHRVADIMAVQRGGVTQVHAFTMDATALTFADGSFDVVTALEVLEHIRDATAAVREICRVARRAVILSFPSHPDDNPEHIHLFDARSITAMLEGGGAARVNTSHVLNHIIVVATKP